MSDKVEMLDELVEIREQIDLMEPAAHKLRVLTEWECVLDALKDLEEAIEEEN